MYVRRLLTAVIIATIAAVTGASPAAQAHMRGDYEFHTYLHGSSHFTSATGYSHYERSGMWRHVDVTVNHVQRLAGKRVIVYVNYHRVGRMWVSSTGYAHRSWDTSRGQYVPYCMGGDPIRVRTVSGVLVATGWYQRMW